MQYKVLYRILGTDDLLFKINRHDDGKCSFCKEYNETIFLYSAKMYKTSGLN